MTEALKTLLDLEADRLTPRQRLCHKLRDGKYRARLAGAPFELVTIAKAVAAGMLEQTKCYYCYETLGAKYTLEHKTPLDRGGGHFLSNITKACLACNEAKHIMTEVEFNRYRMYLETMSPAEARTRLGFGEVANEWIDAE